MIIILYIYRLTRCKINVYFTLAPRAPELPKLIKAAPQSTLSSLDEGEAAVTHILFSKMYVCQ